MSGGLSDGYHCSLYEDDLEEIRERFKELTKEKEMLRDSKSQSFDLIRRLDFHVKTLSESREEDRKRIADLERELSNCSQEIEYLQDQLRNSNPKCPGEQLCSFQLELADKENLAAEVGSLREQLKISESERLLLIQEMEDKEIVIRDFESRTEKLEESISYMALEYECEIESVKLESISLQQNLIETKKLLEEKAHENSRLKELIESLVKENKDFKGKLQSSDMDNDTFVSKVEAQFHESSWETDSQSASKLEKDMRTNGTISGPLFSKLAIPSTSDADLHSKMAEMSCQIDNYELLVRRLKEELKEEKLKAKEEGEDLAQEMAELRYQLTLMLDEERKRRASVEQISLQRIAELEAQIAKERQKSISSQNLVVRSQ